MRIPEDLKNFLKSEDVCAIAVKLPDGNVHVAPVLFWLDVTNLCVYFSTGKGTEKMSWLSHGEKSAKASAAIGLRRKLPYSLQMRGRISLFDPNQISGLPSSFKKSLVTLMISMIRQMLWFALLPAGLDTPIGMTTVSETTSE